MTSSGRRKAKAVAALAAGSPVVMIHRHKDVEVSTLVCRGIEAEARSVNLMAGAGHSLIMVCLRRERLVALGLPAEPRELEPGFPRPTFSVDAANGGTGISAADRALAIAIASDPAAQPTDLVMPGHVFPVSAADRGDHREQDLVAAAIGAAREASGIEAAALSPIIGPSGRPVDAAAAKRFAAEHGLEVLNE